LGLIIQPPYTQIVVYDPGGSSLGETLSSSPDFGVSKAISMDELQKTIGNMGFGLGAEIGIEIPLEFDQYFESEENPKINGYVSWANRTKAAGLKQEMETALLELTGKPIVVIIDGNIISPPKEIGLLVGLVTMFAVTIILTIGVILVPTLLLEEKQSRTLDALLVSPANISQIVIGKAIAGFFYIFVTAVIIYLIYWTGVVHWGITGLFVIGAGLFSVAVGLLFGILFNNQQEMTGWLSFIMILISGSIFIELINLEVSNLIEVLLQWLPPVALAKLFWASFSTQVQFSQVWINFAITLFVSSLLYGYIIWRIKQLDR
jgi:ABC-2 type transport system permease protein